MSYNGLAFAIDQDSPHLGGNPKLGDPFTFCPNVLNYVVGRFGVRSVLDLGSGTGMTSHYLHSRGLQVVAVDGLIENVESSVYPTIRHDLTEGPVKVRVDLVYCQEVVEHVEEKFVGNVVDSLCNGRIILMTHALPGQGGYHHVNLQPPEYWINHLAKRGWGFLEEDTNRIRKIGAADGARYIEMSGLLFGNESFL